MNKENCKKDTLSSLCVVMGDGDWIESKDQSKSGIRLIQTGNIGNGEYLDKPNHAKYISEETFSKLKCTEVLPNDILISRLPAPVGRCCIVPNTLGKSITAVDCTIIRTNPEKCHLRYLYYFLQSGLYFNQIETTGTTRDRVTRKKLEKIIVPVYTLSEQKRIVSHLDNIFSKLYIIKSTYHKQLDSLEEMYMSFQKSLVSKNSASWIHTTIGETCNLETGGTPSKTKTEYFKDGDINWLVSGDIHKKEIYECDGRITKAGLDNSNARYLPIDSVLIALNGQGKTRGTVAMLRIKATCNQSLVSIYPRDTSKLLPEYIFWNLDSRYTEIRKLTSDDGNDRRGLNMPIIKKIDMSYPADIEKQREIINNMRDYKNKVELLKKTYQHKLTCVEELRKSILDKAFRGELLK